MQVDTHAHQAWWDIVSSFQDYTPFYLPSSLVKIPFRPRTVVHGSQKIESNRIGSKNSCKYRSMKYAYIPSLVGMVSLASKISLFSVFLQICPSEHGLHVVSGVKKWNWLKKFTQIEFDEVHICTKFGG